MSEEIVSIILSCLNINTLQRLKNKCESYLTYCIDFKQINGKYGVKNKQKDFADLLEMVNTYIAIKQLESDKTATSSNSGELNNITSCMENDSQQESKKKERKVK